MSKYGRLSQVDPNSLEGKLRGAISEQHKSDNTADVYWHWTEKFCRWLKKETGNWLHPKDGITAAVNPLQKMGLEALERNKKPSPMIAALSNPTRSVSVSTRLRVVG